MLIWSIFNIYKRNQTISYFILATTNKLSSHTTFLFDNYDQLGNLTANLKAELGEKLTFVLIEFQLELKMQTNK